MTSQKYDDVIRALRRQGKARVVLLYTDVQHIRPLLKAVERSQLRRIGEGGVGDREDEKEGEGELVWVGSDSAFTVLQHNPYMCRQNLGSMAVKAYAHIPHAFK
jgi:hypothetical protein